MKTLKLILAIIFITSNIYSNNINQINDFQKIINYWNNHPELYLGISDKNQTNSKGKKLAIHRAKTLYHILNNSRFETSSTTFSEQISSEGFENYKENYKRNTIIRCSPDKTLKAKIVHSFTTSTGEIVVFADIKETNLNKNNKIIINTVLESKHNSDSKGIYNDNLSISYVSMLNRLTEKSDYNATANDKYKQETSFSGNRNEYIINNLVNNRSSDISSSKCIYSELKNSSWYTLFSGILFEINKNIIISHNKTKGVMSMYSKLKSSDNKINVEQKFDSSTQSDYDITASVKINNLKIKNGGLLVYLKFDKFQVNK